MSARVRKAVDSDVDAICQLLHAKMNRRIPVERWRHLMTYSWLEHKPDFGRVVESDGKVEGFCGMVYADRLVGPPDNVRKERVVSMSSWYLDKSLRGLGLGRDMLLSAIEDRSLTYATLTNSRKPLAIVESLGFRILEDHRFVWNKTAASVADVLIIDDLTFRLSTGQKEIIDDMSGLPLTPVYIECSGEQALLFFSVKSKGAGTIWYDLMYTSNPDLFSHCAQSLANQLLPDTPSVLAADGRFVTGQAHSGLREPLPVGRYFISERVQAHELDNLYSELQLLDLKLD